MMGLHRQPLKSRGTDIRTFVNPNRVRVGRIEQRLRDEGVFSTSSIEPVTKRRVHTKKR